MQQFKSFFLKILPLFFLFKGVFIFSQINEKCNNKEFENLLNKVKKSIDNKEFATARKYLNASEKTIKKCNYNKILYHSYKAYFLRLERKYDEAFYHYKKALSFPTEKNKDYYLLKSSILKSLAIISYEIENTEDYLHYLNEALKFSKLSKDSISISSSLNNLGVYYDKSENFNKSLVFYKEALKYTKNKSLLYQNIGSTYLLNKKLDSSFYYLNKGLATAKDSITLSLIYLNLSRVKKENKENIQRLNYLLKALGYLKNKDFISSENKPLVYEELFETYYNLKDYENSIKYLKLYNELKSAIKNENIINNINDLNIKYETAEKEKKILETEAKRKKNKNLLIGSLLFIFLGSTIGVLLLKNSKKKQKLAEQEKEIQTQKNLTLLKEKELNIINAMVTGQEKERKLIAEDLHDNLGSVLATLKLHIENLQMNIEKKKINQKDLFEKTENLIDEAYLKVRSIAHAKNAGVIAKQGLLFAIKMMADKIAVADKINIDVIDFGLDKPLENSLEITTFRIIQELITNVLKHAEAKNITINISLYDNELQIIIEDDGKGFDANAIDSKKGMGITSIETRISHLNGTFEIDSTLGKGTSVLINIPLK
ncbi:ATP-binding protein [Polaribacter aestuariivivens]|uniref:tetratricopeptide repeat-containing sensor histidine kinase n=1 Tax=Polaribacter aestuariivivens TaxID=2304626 RepID=UPI003F493DC3